MASKDIKQQLAAIRRSYIDSLVDKSADINRFTEELSKEWNEETYEKLYIIIHSLAGSAGTFDLDDLSANAREVVNLFKENQIGSGPKRPDDKLFLQIRFKIAELLKQMTDAS